MTTRIVKHHIDFSNVMTTVVTGCILGALGVFGTMVYQGAILRTQTNEAASQVIMESVSYNTVAIVKLTELIEAKLNVHVDTPYRHPVIPASNLDADCPRKKSVLSRIADTVILKPLWESDDLIPYPVEEDVAVVVPVAQDVGDTKVFTSWEPFVETNSVTEEEQLVELDNIQRKISTRTKSLQGK